MKFYFFIFCICIAISCSHTESQNLVLSKYQYDFGKVKQGELCNGQVKLYNLGQKVVHISKVVGDCSCTTAFIVNRTIAKGDSTILHFTLNTKNKKGEIENFVIVEANTDSILHYVKLTANVE